MVPFQAVVHLLSDWSSLPPYTVGGPFISFTCLLIRDLNTRVFSDQTCNMASPSHSILVSAFLPFHCGLDRTYSPPLKGLYKC